MDQYICANISELLKRAAEAGVFLSHRQGRLHFKLSVAVFPEALKNEIAANKAALIAFLKRRQFDDESTLSPPTIRPSNGKAKTASLSFAQQRIWFIDQMGGGSAQYNMPGAMWVRGRFDESIAEQAFIRIIQRHGVLRTVFLSTEEGPVQHVRDKFDFQLGRIDLHAIPRESQEREVMRLADSDAMRPFDLSADLMLRASFIRLSEDEGVLLFNMHHIASDGWSAGILVKEFGQLYEAFSEGKPYPLMPLLIQYADYAEWQRDWVTGEVLERQLSYWEKQLSDLPQVHGLPLDRPRPAVQSFNGAVHSFELEPEILYGLKQLAFNERATLFMVLHGVFALLLSRYANSEDIVIGTPVANRLQKELEPLVGFLVNMLVLRADCSGGRNFREYLRHIKSVNLDAQANQDVPFEHLVERLKPCRSASHEALFQIMLRLNTDELMELRVKGLTLTPLSSDRTAAKFDISLDAVERDDRLGLSLTYNTDLFDALTIARMGDHFKNLARAIVANPNGKIQELPLLTESERRHLLYELNETAADYPPSRCLHELFEAQAERSPESVAVVYGHAMLSYGELNRRANQLAHYLMGQGAGPEVRVAICMGRGLEMVVALLGVLKAGSAYVPLDPQYPQQRLEFMVEDSQATMLLTDRRFAEQLSNCHARLICLEEKETEIASADDTAVDSGVTSQNLAYVIYTSGSTGKPKGVAIEHRSAGVLMHWSREVFSDEELQGVLGSTSICFDLSVFEIFLPLSFGGKLILAENALQLPNLFARNEVTLVNTVPSAMAELIKTGGVPESVRTVNLAGEPLRTELVKAAYQQKTIRRVFDLYGPSEDTTYSTYALRSSEGPATIGRPIANTQLYLLDGNQRLTPFGAPGEIYLGGEGLARHYLNQPELTAERFVPDPYSNRAGARLYRTGDLARYLPDGNIEYLGRLDHQVKIRGSRIELEEIQLILIQHPAVQQALVVAREDTPGDKRLVVYAVSNQDRTLNWGELRGYLKQWLPEYMLPSALVVLDKLPLTPNGKVDRRALPAPEGLRPDLEAVYVAPRNELERAIAAVWREVLRVDKVGADDNFFDLGGHSLLLTQVHGRLRAMIDESFSLIDLFKYPTIRSLAAHLGREPQEQESVSPTHNRAALRQQFAQRSASDIAIIGMAGRFPGANDIEEFWRNLRDGVESISAFTDEELQSSGIDPALLHDPDYVKAAGVLKDAQWFDAAFFGFNPREADLMDPQHRQFLEVAWAALERAGYNPGTYSGAIGVYAGVGLNSYLLFNLIPNRELVKAIGSYQTLLVNDKDFLPTRVSYQLNLRGPSVAVQTACSTSLVAIHQACQSILNGECDMALAGGASVQATPGGYLYQEGGILSPDGHCRAFDSKAQGTVGGSGVAIVVLKRLAEAVADGDNILAVIKGTAVNNDGSLKAGYTAPSVNGQAAVISEALTAAGIEPETTHYVETHGTGTALGDPIEIMALTQAYRAGTQKKGYCAIGSVKTNVGHLDAAAGATGLIKTVLAMQNKLIPPILHFEHPNPHIDFANSPFYVNTELSEWKANGLPRRAGVSSFGIGGTNAHIILEEAPPPQASSKSRPWQLLTLSARTPSALETATTNLADHLIEHPDLNLADVAYTLQVGRKGFDHRRMLVCQTLEDAVTGLRYRDPRRVLTSRKPFEDRSIVFMFPGQGTQYINMGRDLYETEPTFRQQVDHCCELLKPHLGFDLRTLLYPTNEREGEAAQEIRQTSVTQPALFVVEYALAQLWLEWGVQPRAMIGHSIGEYVAACLAGVFTLEDALAVVAARGRLMQELPGGAMLSVVLPPEEIGAWLNDELSLAAINAPSLCVVSGSTEAVELLQRQLTERGLDCRRLHTSHAFHSKMLEPMLADFANEISRAQLNVPRIPYISNLTGTWVESSQARDPQYWVRHARETVRFAEGISRILEDEDTILLEVGPGRTLTTLARKQAGQTNAPVAASSLRHPEDRQPDGAFLMETLGRLWLAGAQVDWTRLYRDERRHRVLLPTYPFERQRFWVEPPRTADRVSAHTGPLFKKPDPADWLYVPFWKPSVTPVRSATEILAQENSCWLVFLDSCGLGAQIAERLMQEEQEVITISIGEQFARLDSGAYSLDPRQRGGYAALLNELRALDKIPERIVHLWSVTPKGELEYWSEYGSELFEETQYLGLYSLLFLAQALAEQGMPDKIVLNFISNHLVAAQGYEELRPDKATALGPCKVIPQEYPHIACRAIDVAIADSGTPHRNRLIDQILDELTATVSDTLVALRGGQRWVQSYEAAGPDGNFKPEPRLRERGVYWITGGLGNIGLSLAEYLAHTLQARLVLTGRSSFPERREWSQWLAEYGDQDEVSRKIQKLQAMEETGAEVLVLSADLSMQDQVKSVVDRIDERFGRIDGVIHAAGMTGAESMRAIADTGPIECARHFRPKLHGLVVLEKALRGKDLDFCLLYSSLSSILGGLGFAAYSAANLFMDAFAHQQSRSSYIPWISVNWDGWKRSGAAESAQGLEATSAELALTSQEGIRCFQRIVSLVAGPQMVVSTGDLQTRIDQWINLDPLRKSEQAKSSEPSPRHARSNIATTYVAPNNELEATIADIWQELLGIDSVGVHDDFFELGGHSLLATQLTSRLCQTFHVSLSVAKVFETPTVFGLAESINKIHWASQALSAFSMAMEPGREKGEL